MRAWVLRWAAFLALASPFACQGSLTEVILVVDSDLQVPEELDGLKLAIHGSSPEIFQAEQRLSAPSDLPQTLGLLPATDEAGEVLVEVIGQRRGVTMVQSSAHTRFAVGERRVLTVALWALCRGVTCSPETQTCGEGGSCVSNEVAPSSLLPWAGRLPPKVPVHGPLPASLGAALPLPMPASSGRSFHLSPHGDDAAPGTKDQPFGTLLHAVSFLAPGDTLLFSGGTYPELPSVMLRGEPRAPITLAAAKGEVVIVPNIKLSEGSEFVRLQGFVVDGALGFQAFLVSISDPSRSVEVSGCEIKNGTKEGLFAAGDDHWLVANWVHNNGTSAHEGIQARGNRTVIANNLVHDNIGFGVTLYPEVLDGIIIGNTVVTNGRSGLSIGAMSERAIIVNNVFAFHEHQTDSSSGYGIRMMAGTSSAAGHLARRNILFGNRRANSSEGPGLTLEPSNLIVEPGFVDRGPEPPNPTTCCSAGPPPQVIRDLTPGPGSPALDAGLLDWGLSPDGRGQSRPIGIGLDIGALEAN